MSDVSSQPTEQKQASIARSSQAVSLLTALSRLFGLLRDKGLVLFFGSVPWMLDSFLLAFTIPNLFRRIFGEGALTAAFLPEFIDAKQESNEEARSLSSSVLTLLLASTGLIAGLGMAACGICLAALPLAPEIALTLRLLLLMLPFLTLICTSAFLAAMLQGSKIFSIPAAMSILLNLCFLGACGYVAYTYWPNSAATADLTFYEKLISIPLRFTEAEIQNGLTWTAYAVLAAGVIQILVQWPVVRATGISLGLGLNLKSTRVRAVLFAMAPTALGLGIVQLNVLVDNLIAYSLSLSHEPYQGANTYLYLGNRLMQLPLGVFGIAIATTSFPFLAEYYAEKKSKQFLDSLLHTMRMLIFIILPASFGLMIMADPLMRLLYQEPDLEFSDAAVYRSSAVLCCYAGGLVFFGINQLLTRAFYARKDYTTPVRVAMGMIVLNLILNLTLIHAPDLYRHWGSVTIPGLGNANAWGQAWLENNTQGLALGEAGLALATTITAILNACILWSKLRGKIKTEASGGINWAEKEGDFGASLFWILIAALAMGAATYFIRNSIPFGPELIWRAEKGLVPVLGGILSYSVACMIFPVREYGEFMSRLPFFRKRMKKPEEVKK